MVLTARARSKDEDAALLYILFENTDAFRCDDKRVGVKDYAVRVKVRRYPALIKVDIVERRMRFLENGEQGIHTRLFNLGMPDIGFTVKYIVVVF